MRLLVVLNALCSAPHDVVVLENGAIRVEIDPQLFAVRYLGPPGGPNFVLPAFVKESIRDSSAWAEPGGVVARVAPLPETDAAIARGPAEILDRSARAVALLGAVSEGSQLRVKKEFTIDPREPELTYTVTVLSLSHAPQRAAVRSVASLNPAGTLHATDPEAMFSHGNDTKRFLHVPPQGTHGEVAWKGEVDSIQYAIEDTVWTRSAVEPAEAGREFPDGTRFECVLNNETHSYTAAYHGSFVMVDASSPVTFREVWRIDANTRVRDRTGE